MGNDKSFQNVLNNAFEHFINLSQRTPEYISLFMDDRLRRGVKGASDEDVEATLDKVMMLFRYLAEKDVFEKYYKQHLAKRLLSGRAVSCLPGSALRRLLWCWDAHTKLDGRCDCRVAGVCGCLVINCLRNQLSPRGCRAKRPDSVCIRCCDADQLSAASLTVGSAALHQASVWMGCQACTAARRCLMTGRGACWSSSRRSADTSSPASWRACSRTSRPAGT